MKAGYLTLETHPNHNHLVRVCMRQAEPDIKHGDDGSVIRYIARFRDVEAAQMHVQNMMHRFLVNLEQRIYRKPLVEMIACVEADELEHKRTWMDPAIGDSELAQIQALTERNRKRHRWMDLIWQAVGIVALILLLVTSLTI